MIFERRRKLKSKLDNESKKLLESVKNELAEKYAKSNFEKINNELADMECDEDGLNIGKLWKQRKKFCPFKKILQLSC